MDREYTVLFEDKNGLQEVGLGSNFKKAVILAKSYAKQSKREITLKHYEDGDLKHQWDLKGGKWVKYE